MMEEMTLGSPRGRDIQLLHANAYTPGCYKEMLGHMAEYRIHLPAQRPLWPGSDPTKLKSWSLFANDIIDHMDQKGRKGVIGIGHSMGGVASWLAAIKRPDLFSRLILIDPVILPIDYFLTMSFLPYAFKKRLVPIIKIAARRKDIWSDRNKAKDYFLSKKVFQRFDPGVLEDFVQYGLIEDNGGVTLAYPKEWESRVYASPPNLWNKMHRAPCPITIIRAEYSDVINDDRWEKIQRKVRGGQFIQMDGARHLVPFEQPEVCANLLLDIMKGSGD